MVGGGRGGRDEAAVVAVCQGRGALAGVGGLAPGRDLGAVKGRAETRRLDRRNVADRTRQTGRAGSRRGIAPGAVGFSGSGNQLIQGSIGGVSGEHVWMCGCLGEDRIQSRREEKRKDSIRRETPACLHCTAQNKTPTPSSLLGVNSRACEEISPKPPKSKRSDDGKSQGSGCRARFMSASTRGLGEISQSISQSLSSSSRIRGTRLLSSSSSSSSSIQCTHPHPSLPTYTPFP